MRLRISKLDHSQRSYVRKTTVGFSSCDSDCWNATVANSTRFKFYEGEKCVANHGKTVTETWTKIWGRMLIQMNYYPFFVYGSHQLRGRWWKNIRLNWDAWQRGKIELVLLERLTVYRNERRYTTLKHG